MRKSKNIDFCQTQLLSEIIKKLSNSGVKRKQDVDHLRTPLLAVFGLLAVGFFFSALAELAWDFLSWIGIEPELGVPDALWIVGVLFLFAGFMFLAVYMLLNHEKLIEGIILLSTISVLLACLIYFVIRDYIVLPPETSAFATFVGYFYPLMDIFLIVAAFSVYFFFRKIPFLGVPLLLLASSNLVMFVGDFLYTYALWYNVYGWIGFFSDFAYGVDYLLAATGLYALSKGREFMARETFLHNPEMVR